MQSYKVAAFSFSNRPIDCCDKLVNQWLWSHFTVIQSDYAAGASFSGIGE